MGNQISNLFNDTSDEATDTTKLKPASVKQIIDYIATYYILTMDFQSLRKLYDIEYCDKLVILTSDIIERYFTDIQISYLAENIKNNKKKESKEEEAEAEAEAEAESEEEEEKIERDKIIFFDKDSIKNLDIKNPDKKRRVCLGIAKFYIKIAHVFATILTTINPIYVYKDEDGNTIKADIYNRNKIPKGTDVEVLKLNICDNRMDSLKRDANVDLTKDLENDTEIKIHPKMCSFNLKMKKDYNDSDSESDTDYNDNLKDLDDEPGIPELMELYYDADYDYETGKFKGMRPETRLLFEENLRGFYSVFADTFNKPMPDTIKKFSDIKLKAYDKKTHCQGKNAPYDRSVRGTLENDLFKQYAENLKLMLKKANSNQELLLDVLNKLFVYMTDPQTKKKIIRINPKLSEDLLQEVIVETRAIIINLYLTCETDFANGIKIYEAIVDKKIIETSKSQIKTTEENMERLVSEEEIPKPAELSELKKIADRKIQQQKEQVSNEANKIQKEQEKIDVVSPVIREPQPIVKKEEPEKPKEPEVVPQVEPKVEQENPKEPEVVEPKVEPEVAKVVEPKVAAPEQPQVKVKINIQGQGENESQAAGTRKYKRKSKRKTRRTKGKR
jgi:hypothetical protein